MKQEIWNFINLDLRGKKVNVVTPFKTYKMIRMLPNKTPRWLQIMDEYGVLKRRM